MGRGTRAAIGAALAVGLTAGAAGAVPSAPHTERSRTERASVTREGTQADAPASGATVSADGRRVAFSSKARSLGGNGRYYSAFVKDLRTGTTRRLAEVAGAQGTSVRAIDAGGRRVLLSAREAGGTALFLRDLRTGRDTRVTAPAPGAWAIDGALAAGAGAVAFGSDASDLVEQDTNGQPDVFLRRGR